MRQKAHVRESAEVIVISGQDEKARREMRAWTDRRGERKDNGGYSVQE